MYIMLIIIGIALKLLVGRRRFYRRNVAGLEEYKNYRSALGNNFLNRSISVIDTILIFVGIVGYITTGNRNGKEADMPAKYQKEHSAKDTFR